VGPDGMATRLDSVDNIGMVCRHLANQEEDCFHTFMGQRVEDMVSLGRQWAVVEGKHDLMIFER